MAAQSTREDKLTAADAVLDNSGTLEQLLDHVDRLWNERLAPFARNLAAGTRASRTGGPVLTPARSEWPQEARRLLARIARALPSDDAAQLDHIGSTSVPGLEAKDIIDLQLTVPDLAVADALAPVLSAAGFPVVRGVDSDTPTPLHPNTRDWAKRFHANADPGRAVNLHVRAAGSPGWRFALCFRDWLRAEPGVADEYLAFKRELAAAHAGDTSTAGYADAKEGWFAAAEERMEGWAERTGWIPPSWVS
jgi:dephospho-CoA kinase